MSPAASHALSHDLLEQHLKDFGLPFLRGIEKEGLRATPDFRISQTDHPHALGHPLTHPLITTDYSEALLELITGVHADRSALINELRDIHTFVLNNLGDETMWPGSMPCALDGDASIRIGDYGSSNIGQIKHVYRRGLGERYGRIMQSIAGMHFNFSLNDALWQSWAETLGERDLKSFKSRRYFGLIRNFRRQSWLLMYLFGASPVLDDSFVRGRPHKLEPLGDGQTWHLPYATSLRMGDLGYHNNAQASLPICFNQLGTFVATLKQAMQTPYPPYAEIGMKRNGEFIQLSTSILQIENEYYSSIRPKRTVGPNEHPSDALSERGVEYVEVRCLDLNPFYDIGTCEADLDFLDLFLTNCLTQPSPYIQDSECGEIEHNFSLTVNEGRRPSLELSRQGQTIPIQTWAQDIFAQLAPLASLLDSHTGDQRYQKAIQHQRDKFDTPVLTPSAHLLNLLQKEKLSWLEFAGELSLKHKLQLKRRAESDSFQQQNDRFREASTASFAAERTIRNMDTLSFEQFLSEYIKVKPLSHS